MIDRVGWILIISILVFWMGWRAHAIHGAPCPRPPFPGNFVQVN